MQPNVRTGFEKAHRSWFGFVQGKTRIYLAWAILILIPFLSPAAPEKIWWPGLVIMGLGVFFRSWASGYILKDNTLAKDGPYAICRNPLYLGTFLMGLGCAFLMKSPLFGILSTVLFGMIYWDTIRFEEEKLVEKFGESYLRFRNETPRFFPSPRSILRSFRKTEKSQAFTWKRLFENRGHEPLLSALGLIALVVLTDSFPWKLMR